MKVRVWHFLTTSHYVNSQSMIISFEDSDFWPKIYIILYPSLEESTTSNTITLHNQSKENLTCLPKLDLISLTSHENSNHGRENYLRSGIQIPTPEGQNFFVFSFSNSPEKYLCFLWFLNILFYKLDINKNKDFQHVWFHF